MKDLGVEIHISMLNRNFICFIEVLLDIVHDEIFELQLLNYRYLHLIILPRYVSVVNIVFLYTWCLFQIGTGNGVGCSVWIIMRDHLWRIGCNNVHTEKTISYYLYHIRILCNYLSGKQWDNYADHGMYLMCNNLKSVHGPNTILVFLYCGYKTFHLPCSISWISGILI